MNKTINYKELENINSIIYSYINYSEEEDITKLINNGEKIICECFINEKLEKTLEIEQEIWNNLMNELFKILKQRNYYWNKNYFVKGDETVFDAIPWKIEIKNKTGEFIEIKCKGKRPEIFAGFLTIIANIDYKIDEKK